MNGQRAEVAARKKQRLHDVRIGRERQAPASCLKHARVVLRFQQRIAEGRYEHPGDELVHQPAPAAVGHQDARIVLNREGTGRGEVI